MMRTYLGLQPGNPREGAALTGSQASASSSPSTFPAILASHPGTAGWSPDLRVPGREELGKEPPICESEIKIKRFAGTVTQGPWVLLWGLSLLAPRANHFMLQEQR